LIILYIFIGIILFLLLLLALMLFIPLKTFVKGTYWDKKPTGLMDVYWIKYFLGSRVRIRDPEYIRILIWFFGIPIPMKFKLKQEAIDNSENEKKESDDKIETYDEPIKVSEKETETQRPVKEKIRELLDAKDKIKAYWEKYRHYVKKIFVSYVTFSIEFIETEIGLKDPGQTGVAAGIVYSALSIRPLDSIKVSWDYAKPNFNISSGIKMTMNLYGILCTLLRLYFRFRKDNKNDVQ